MNSLKIVAEKKFLEFFVEQKSERKIDFLVLHHIEAISADHAIKQLVDYQVSSHFLIDETGKIFLLIDEKDIAYHAGFSFWRGVEGLNKRSIGIEFINSAPFTKKFEEEQMKVGLELCRHLIKKYQIPAQNIVGHSDIAYHKKNPSSEIQPNNCDVNFDCEVPLQIMGFLDRKQDPSHLFNWRFLAENGVGIFPKISLVKSEDKKLFGLGDRASAIKDKKEKLAKIGYKISNFAEDFDLEMQLLTRVFHRRFNQDKFATNPDFWYLSSDFILDDLLLRYQK